MSGTNSGNDERLSRIPEQIKQQAAGIGRAVGDAVGPKAEDIADRSKAAGADAVAGVARTAQALADTVASDSPAIADYVRGAGQKIDRLASDLRDKKVRRSGRATGRPRVLRSSTLLRLVTAYGATPPSAARSPCIIPCRNGGSS